MQQLSVSSFLSFETLSAAAVVIPQELSVSCVTHVGCLRLVFREDQGKKGVIAVGGSIQNEAMVLLHHLKCTYYNNPLCRTRIPSTHFFKLEGFERGQTRDYTVGAASCLSSSLSWNILAAFPPSSLLPPSIYTPSLSLIKKIGTKGEDNEKTVLPILVCCVLP